MGIKFFGQFLTEKKLITEENLLDAVVLTHKTNLLFGETARSMGLITPADIERVQASQRTKDFNFGDLCYIMGILTKDQVKQVAEVQKKNHLLLGDALVKLNSIKAEDLPKLLAEYEADQAADTTPKAQPRTPVPNEDLWLLYADRAYNMFTRVVQITFKPDQRSVVDWIEPNDTIVGMHLTGDAPCRFVLSVSTEIRNAIARAMLHEEDISSEPEEVLIDAIREFLNIICGSIASKVTQIGKKIDYTSAALLEVPDRPDPSSGPKALLFPLHVTEGRVEVAIFWE